MKFGFLPEFIGRFAVYAQLEALTEAQMMHVMTRPRNALLKQYAALFAADQVKLHLTEDAVRAIARKARTSQTGARGLRTIVEGILLDAMFALPQWSERGVRHVIVTEATVVDGAEVELVPSLEPLKEPLQGEPLKGEPLRAMLREETIGAEDPEPTAATG